MTQLDTIEALLRKHIQLSSEGREKTQTDIASALEVTNEIKSGVKGLSLLGKVLGWVGGIAAALAGIVGLWQLLAPHAPGP
jgi:hypothetical protein